MKWDVWVPLLATVVCFEGAVMVVTISAVHQIPPPSSGEPYGWGLAGAALLWIVLPTVMAGVACFMAGRDWDKP